MICFICNKEYDGIRGLASHIRRTHNINQKEYYDKYMKQKSENICPTCGKETPFLGLSGYAKHCNQKCANNDAIILKTKQETCIKRYGVIILKNKRGKR